MEECATLYYLPIFPLHFPLLVTFQRDASQKAWYALLLLDPVPHQLWQVLRTTVSLRNKLHAHPLVILRRLEYERRVEVELRSDTDLTVRVECELDAKNRRDGFLKLVGFGGEDLSKARMSGAV